MGWGDDFLGVNARVRQVTMKSPESAFRGLRTALFTPPAQLLPLTSSTAIRNSARGTRFTSSVNDFLASGEQTM